ncbi:MAG: 50S ribosomal protein L30 [Thermoplasmata archaeon HGW-Thermoplasmata-1]|nr:MAG: 50S ribosomal protein L30 [Thermoplasmata archaeon HGW-Thermoplasmata-1]
MAYAAVRVRGKIGIRPQTRDTLKYLRLNRANHCVVVPDNETYKGMFQDAKDYITWGEVDTELVAEMIKTRGRLVGDKVITDEYVKETTSFENIDAFAKAVAEGTFKFKDLAEVKPLFRLHPPRRGFEGIKRSFVNGGALGYRGKEINALIRRML